MTHLRSARHRFHGHIAGAGTRLVLGCWTRTPHGPFSDVMVAHPGGRREPLAPDGRALTFTRAGDVVARRVVPGARTPGTAGKNRLEWYSASDLHGLSESIAAWDGATLGTLTGVTPPPDFGFSSTPRKPGLTALPSTVRAHVRPGNNSKIP